VKDVAGKSVPFAVKVKEVREKRLPPVDDAFAKAVAGCETVLDIGCGPGDLVIELARLAPGLRVTGEDGSLDGGGTSPTRQQRRVDIDTTK